MFCKTWNSEIEILDDSQTSKYLETETVQNAIKNDTEFCNYFCNDYIKYLQETNTKYDEVEIKNRWYNPNKYGYTLEHIKTWCKNMKVNLLWFKNT